MSHNFKVGDILRRTDEYEAKQKSGCTPESRLIRVTLVEGNCVYALPLLFSVEDAHWPSKTGALLVNDAWERVDEATLPAPSEDK